MISSSLMVNTISLSAIKLFEELLLKQEPNKNMTGNIKKVLAIKFKVILFQYQETSKVYAGNQKLHLRLNLHLNHINPLGYQDHLIFLYYYLFLLIHYNPLYYHQKDKHI